LDDGRLTDGQGTVVDFTNTVVIFTSNLGAMHLLRAVGKENSLSSNEDYLTEMPAKKRVKIDSDEEMGRKFNEAKKLVMKDVKVHFRPEFLNRLDEIVVFEPLKESVLRSVVEIQLKTVMKRLESDRQIKVTASKGALDMVVSLSYDPVYGARPIRRYIERGLATELSKKILMGAIPDGSTVLISLESEAPKSGKTTSLGQGFALTIVPPKLGN